MGSRKKNPQQASTKLAKGALVWVRHPTEAWRPATVGENLPKGRMRVFYGDGADEIVRSSANYPILRTIPCDGDIEVSGGLKDEEEEDLFSDDLTKMTQLVTPAVLHSLRKAYDQERFYSKLGSGTVLALNPFKEIPGLFTLKTIQSYHSVSLSELQHLPAHVYAAAQSALVTLRASVGKVNQSIIVSGESGAGKTWTVRCLMRYLAEVGIEYKRRLSSTEMSSTPLKGYHVTPIRASMKTTIHDVRHPHAKSTQKIPNHPQSIGQERVNIYYNGNKRVNANSEVVDDDTVAMATQETLSTNISSTEWVDFNSTGRERDNLHSDGDQRVNLNSEVVAMATDVSLSTTSSSGGWVNFNSTGDGGVNVSTATNRKYSSSFEEISDGSLNVNINNNNQDEQNGKFFGAGDAPEPPQQKGVDKNANVGKILDFGEEETMSDGDSDGELLGENATMESEDILGDMEETVDDLNISIKIVDRIERRILHSNPILEAFGNAHTLRNGNSSRFGKYIQLQYDRSGTIVGAQLRTYLLEKTRAVRHDPGERSYHIFYQVLHGATAEERNEWSLPESPFPEESRECTSAVQQEFRKEQKSDFLETRISMLRIGILDETQRQIFKLLSAVLHLRQLSFEGSDDLQNPCTLEEANPMNKTSLKTAAELLGVQQEVMMRVITFREITAHSNRRKSVFHRPSTVEECGSRRDSLIKLIYEILFHWIVQRVGDSVCAPRDKWCSFIGLLDVYGFESFENNSLEQLCINYANEKLQQHFVSSFLREQQEEYISEGVSWTHCDLTDNVECLLALEAPRTSLFSLLNEECRLNRARAGGHLKNRVESMFKDSKYIIQPRISAAAPSFSVVHYAGQVSYRTEDLIEKNKDEVPAEITQLLVSSGNNFVYKLVNEHYGDDETDVETQNKGKHRPTVLTRFKKSLDDLLDTLTSTDCHYIRCIKPNKASIPGVFDAQFVLNQLEACGVVETIRVCAPAHPNKLSYNEFLTRYGFLLRRGNATMQQTKQTEEEPSHKKRRRSLTNIDLRRDACERILKVMQRDDVLSQITANSKQPLQYGNTKIFLSSEMFEALESSRSQEIVKCTVIVQRGWRQFVLIKKCRAERKALIAKRENASTLLQNAWKFFVNLRRCRAERKELILRRLESATMIQRCWFLHRRKTEAKMQRKILIKKRQEAAISIQSAFRGWRIRYKYKDLLDAWKQLKLLPEKDYREMVEKRLRLLIGSEPALSPSPSYEAIRATFEMPAVQEKESDIAPSSDSGYSRNSFSSESGNNPEKLTVYYEKISPKRELPKETIIQDDLEPFEGNLHGVIHLHRPLRQSKSPMHERNRPGVTKTPTRHHNSSDLGSSFIHDSFESERNSPMHDSNRSSMWRSEGDNIIEQHLRSGDLVRHATLVRSTTNLDKVVEKVERSPYFPKFPKGPGIIYAWHNRACISMMTSKRPLSLCSDPLTLIEMQYNQSSSVLTTPISSLQSQKRSRHKKHKHRHSNRHTRLSPPHPQTSPYSHTWSPGQFCRIPKSGSNCILKYADVPPKTPLVDVSYSSLG